MIITISRDFGAGATSVARLVAERCGYRIVDDDLTARVASRLNIDYPLVTAEEDVRKPFLSRLSQQLPGAAIDFGNIPDSEYEASFSETRRAIECEILNEAQRDNVVIVGRAAAFVLGPRPNLVRVFLHAPLQWRIARLVEQLNYTSSQAKETVKRLDEARAAYVRDNYSASPTDARAYDLTIDTSTTGFENAAEVVVLVAASRNHAR